MRKARPTGNMTEYKEVALVTGSHGLVLEDSQIRPGSVWCVAGYR